MIIIVASNSPCKIVKSHPRGNSSNLGHTGISQGCRKHYQSGEGKLIEGQLGGVSRSEIEHFFWGLGRGGGKTCNEITNYFA